MNSTRWFALMALAALGGVQPALAAGDLPSKFSNHSTVANTRHNLTQRQASGGPNGSIMDGARNNYQQVCVYCHTPHGAATNVALPLWNRTTKATTYTLYSSDSITGVVTAPGANSLSCLSCHDGQIAVDSIINMPGSGRYNAAQASTQNNTFLDSWPDPSGYSTIIHGKLTTSFTEGCLACHAPGTGIQGVLATDFTVAMIGTDLRNDHPVGVKLPVGSDWNVPNGAKGSTRFFDADGNGQLSKDEIRLYDSGQGPEVECATCHDPHGVPSGAPGSPFIATFLRRGMDGSGVCLTCHAK